MSPAVVALSYVGVGAAGFACGWVTCRAAARWAYVAGVDDERVHDVDETPIRRHGGPSWLVYLIVAAVVAVGVGVGVLVTDRATDRAAQAATRERTAAFSQQTACINRWGAEITETITVRVMALDRLDRAEARRDRTFDQVVAVSTRVRRDPPEAADADLTAALERADQARLNLAEVRAEVEDTRSTNPYPPPPTLTCPTPPSSGDALGAVPVAVRVVS